MSSSSLGRPAGERRMLRRIALVVFFASVAVNTALGIYALVTPDFGETEGKILGTSLAITGALVVALLCTPAWERRLLGPLPPIGMALGAGGFALMVVGLWAEPSGEAFGKATGTLLLAAAGATLVCLLALATLPSRYRWLFALAALLIAAAVVLAAIGIWAEIDAEWYPRAMGVVAILAAAMVVTIPVVHRVTRQELRDEAAQAEPTGVGFCPFCGEAIEASVGMATSCDRCGRPFRVTAS